ncbi:amidohydrolase family protein [Sphingomonas crocodyli]|uniref:amidohydrolase family protein n=1 Tax=Sphingomonas crocodyli TaxID=1979270 RepID=UPI0013E2CDFE|nr:amidohydrolase family protein [Sphingomonas crocodyli]
MFDIVDTQVHLNRLGDDWIGADPDALIARGIAAMDAAGVTVALIDERAAPHILNDPDPNATTLPSGAQLLAHPFADRAVAAHPDRFAIIARIDWRDPAIADRIAELRGSKGVVATQIAPTLRDADWAAFESGGFDPYFAAAERAGLPLFAFVSGRIDAVVPYVRRFPGLTFILDHWGFPMPHEDAPRGEAHLARVLALAEHPNLHIKWCKGPQFVAPGPYPHVEMHEPMRRMIDAFGPDRIVWASDITQARGQFSWAETIHQIRDCPVLSDAEKAAVLGCNARRLLGLS